LQKRIYFVSFYYPPLNRSRRRYHYARALADAGFEVEVVTIANPSGLFNKFTMDPQAEVQDPEVKTSRLRVTPWWALGEALYVAGILQCPQANWGWVLARKLQEKLRAKPGIVVAVYPPLSTLEGCLKATQSAGCPLVIDFRDEFLKEAARSGGKPFSARARRTEQRLVTGADLISVHAEPARDYLAKRNNIDPQEIVVVRNGIGGELPEVAPRDFSGKLKVVYAGAITRHQAPEVFCKAWRLLRKRNPEIAEQISITFYGPDNHYVARHLRPALREPNVTYGGFVGADEAQKRLGEADVAFLSLASDHVYATPSKLFEYIGLGLPILASVPDGDAAALIRKHDVGLVAPAGDAEALARLLEETASDRARFKHFSENALAARPHLTFKEQVTGLACEIERRFCE
jgi:glycosyltransferase involved in cell wall biosynthesis